MLTIKDLAAAKELDVKEMGAVRGGYSGAVNQANQTYQAIDQKLNAPVYVGNGSAFMGKGSTSFDVTSNPTMTASNDSHSSNHNSVSKGWGFPVLF